MAYEIVQITSWTTSAGSITNPTYAYDNGAVGSGPVTGTSTSSYTNTNDTSYANQSSALSTTQYTLTSSGMSARSQTWTSSTLYVTYTLITSGDGDITQWDSFAELNYCTDGSTFSNTIAASSQDNNTGRVTFSVALGANPTLANIKIQALLTGHGKTGAIPDIIAGSSATCYLYHAYVEGIYTAFSVTSLNSGSYCNIGSIVFISGVGLTGSTAVTINGVSASFTVSNSTTIQVTIPAMSSYGAVTVSVTNGTTQSCTGYINTPIISMSVPTSGGNCLASSTVSCTATVTNLESTTINWTADGGSFSPTSTTSGGSTTWTAPASPSSNGASYTLTATASGNASTNTSVLRNVYFVPIVTSFTGSLANGSTVVNGSTQFLTWATQYATAIGSNFGATATAWTAYNGGTVVSNTVTNYSIQPTNPGGAGSVYTVSVNAIAAPSITNNGPVLLNTNVTLTPTFGAGVGVSVAPGSWGAWTTGVGQTVALPYNKVYTLTQSGIGTATTVPQAKLPVTPAASISMSQVRQIVTGGGSGSIDINDNYIRILSSTSNLSQVSFSQLSGTYLPTSYNW